MVYLKKIQIIKIKKYIIIYIFKILMIKYLKDMFRFIFY
jgi:hypothetical protein